MATVYCVLENNRPAYYPNKDTEWYRWTYRTYDEAFEYLKKWLGGYSAGLTPADLPVGEPYSYNGYDQVSICLIDESRL